MRETMLSVAPIGLASPSARETELKEAIALAVTSLATEPNGIVAARRICLKLECSLLASQAGGLALALLETIDHRLRETIGEHDLFDGRYA